MPDKLIVTVDPQIAGLVPRFLANRAADVEKIRAALACADFEAVRATGHGLKGVGGGYGFPRISQLGAAIEEAAERCEAGVIASLAADLADYLARVEVRHS
jgi:histidine phosphotransfer protein HptB